MFRIKICGIKTPEDARIAVNAGADAIGLNFYEKSSRYVAPAEAQQIAAELDDSTHRIGVFVNKDTESIKSIATEACLTAVQLHGDEPPESMVHLAEHSIVRARRIDDRGIAAISADLTACQATGRTPDAILVDAMTPGHYGGTGKTINWECLKDYQEWLGDVPLVLAGGLTPDNIAEAILAVRPHGVDVASGVESTPGVKDPAKMRSFIEIAKRAFDEVNS